MKKKIKQAGRLYFSQTDWMRPVGAGLLVVSIVWFWAGLSAASYYGPCILLPIGLVLFFVGNTRYITDNDIISERDRLLADYDKSVTDMDDYDRKILKQPADIVNDAWDTSRAAALFKRNKAGTLVSDMFVRSHFFFTKDALLVCARRVSLTEMDPENGLGTTDLGGHFSFADITDCRLEESQLTVTVTNTKKPATAHQCEFVLTGRDGELLRLPVKNDMDITHVCEEIKRRIG